MIGGLAAAPLLAAQPAFAKNGSRKRPRPIPPKTPPSGPIPRAGEGFLLGMYCSNLSDVTGLETTVGRHFHGTCHYRDCNAWTSWPTSAEAPFVNRGNVARFPLESRVFNYANYTPPSGVPRPTWRHVNPANGSEYVGYRHVDFTNGSLDYLLNRMATGIKSFPGTVILDYDHEMDDNRYTLAAHANDWGPITYNRSMAFTNPARPNPREYVEAHRYIVDYLRGAGVENVLYAFCPAGWTLGRNSSRLAELYPGDAWVDMVMWDPYNGPGSWRSFADIVSPMYSAIDGGLYGSGAVGKARFLGEFGCRYRDNRRAGWLTDMMSEVEDFPALRGGLWFSSGSWGAIHGSNMTSAERPRFQELVNSSYFNAWQDTNRISPRLVG